MKTYRVICFAIVVALACLVQAEAGDNYWSPAPISSVSEFAVCGTTVYAATANGLYRSTGDPEQWEILRGEPVAQVACDGNKVIWAENSIPVVVYVSHDALQTVHVANGLSSAISSGVRDMAISGNTALVAEHAGVWRSTDGGLNFPAAYPVLWESSAGYEISGVWTNGTHCAAAGSGGFAGWGIWHSATGEIYTWTQVLDATGQGWLDGTGSSTLVSGAEFSGRYADGYISTDSGATWDELPLVIGTAGGDYQRPFISGPMVLSRSTYDVFDPNSGTFIPHSDGPYIYDLDEVDSSNMDEGFPSEEQLRNQIIVETPDPWLLVAEFQGAAWWYRLPGGWPATFDFQPPWPGSVTASPTLATRATPGSASLSLTASGASSMWLAETVYQITASHTYGSISTYTQVSYLPSALGWQGFNGNTSFGLGTGHGLHVIDAWYRDAAGNMTDPSVWGAMTTVPSSATIHEGGCVGFWFQAGAGESFSVGASVGGGGDIDVMHFEPGSYWSDNYSWATGVNDTLNFTTVAAGFHDVYLCNWPGYGLFSGTISAAKGVRYATGPVHHRQRTYSVTHETPTPEGRGYHDATWDTIFADGFESGTTGSW